MTAKIEKEKVLITDPEHPHYGEAGTFTGKVITFKHWQGRMAEIKLDSCAHGTSECFVSPGQVRAL